MSGKSHDKKHEPQNEYACARPEKLNHTNHTKLGIHTARLSKKRAAMLIVRGCVLKLCVLAIPVARNTHVGVIRVDGNCQNSLTNHHMEGRRTFRYPLPILSPSDPSIGSTANEYGVLDMRSSTWTLFAE